MVDSICHWVRDRPLWGPLLEARAKQSRFRWTIYFNASMVLGYCIIYLYFLLTRKAIKIAVKSLIIECITKKALIYTCKSVTMAIIFSLSALFRIYSNKVFSLRINVYRWREFNWHGWKLHSVLIYVTAK